MAILNRSKVVLNLENRKIGRYSFLTRKWLKWKFTSWKIWTMLLTNTDIFDAEPHIGCFGTVWDRTCFMYTL